MRLAVGPKWQCHRVGPDRPRADVVETFLVSLGGVSSVGLRNWCAMTSPRAPCSLPSAGKEENGKLFRTGSLIQEFDAGVVGAECCSSVALRPPNFSMTR